MTAIPLYPQLSENMPAPLIRGSLSDLVDAGDQTGRPVKAFVGHNLGYRTFTVVMTMREFYDQSAVANEVTENGEITQRKLDDAHAFELGKYILRGVVSSVVAKYERNNLPIPEPLQVISNRVGRQPYTALQPIVANIRTCKAEGHGLIAERLLGRHTEDTVAFKVTLLPRDILWVVDGQHRRAAIDLVIRFLQEISKSSKYPKKKGKSGSLYDYDGDGSMTSAEWRAWGEILTHATGTNSVVVEVHLGLDFAQERQLFHDLNNLGKKVERSLALSFDAANPINAFVRDELDGKIIQVCDSDRKDWSVDDGQLPLRDLVAINSHLFLNKTNAATADSRTILSRTAVARRFWTTVKAIPHFGKAGMFANTVAAQSAVLKALAKLTFDFGFGRKADPVLLDQLLNGLASIDFSHNNPMWRYYDLDTNQRAQFGLTSLSTYLPSMTKDLGRFDKGKMRFGTAHNDIFPVIGDMIRWKLGLPAR